MKENREVSLLQLDMIRDFGESVPDLFNDILMPNNADHPQKSDPLSAEHREKGNKLYQKKKLWV